MNEARKKKPVQSVSVFLIILSLIFAFFLDQESNYVPYAVGGFCIGFVCWLFGLLLEGEMDYSVHYYNDEGRLKRIFVSAINPEEAKVKYLQSGGCSEQLLRVDPK